MRIDDVKRAGFERATSVKRPNDADAPGSIGSRVEPASTDTETRTERIEKLKQMFAAGRPIDVEQLANKLIESGVVFEKKS